MNWSIFHKNNCWLTPHQSTMSLFRSSKLDPPHALGWSKKICPTPVERGPDERRTFLLRGRLRLSYSPESKFSSPARIHLHRRCQPKTPQPSDCFACQWSGNPARHLMSLLRVLSMKKFCGWTTSHTWQHASCSCVEWNITIAEKEFDVVSFGGLWSRKAWVTIKKAPPLHMVKRTVLVQTDIKQPHSGHIFGRNPQFIVVDQYLKEWQQLSK